MVFHLLRAKRSMTSIAGSAPVEPPVPTLHEAAPTMDASAMVKSTVDLFEQDVARNVRALAGNIAQASDQSGQVQACLNGIATSVSTLVGASERVDSEVAGIAGSADELSMAANEILQTVDIVSSRSSSAVASAEQSARDVESLGAAITEIGGMLNAISEIASRTNLLALNATIEAARAGEAGRGFAVVAQEVKALSVAAGGAVTSIRERMEALQSASFRAIDGMKRICAEVGEMAPVAATISQAADEQRSTIVDLAGRMGDARIAVASLSDAIRSIDRMSSEAGALCHNAVDLNGLAAADASTLERRMTMMLRGTGVADRRAHERFPVDLAVRVRLRGEMLACRTFDLSEGGVLLRASPALTPTVGAVMEAELSRIGAVRLKVVALSSMGVHCAFEGLDGAARLKLQEVLAAFEAENTPLIERSQAFAGEIQNAFLRALEAKTLSVEALFDTQYQPVPESDPAQFTNRATEQLESLLPAILERHLRMDSRMAFCLAVDRNGYGAVHNLKVSKPQKKGDRAWNMANCRNRRIFDDRAGLLAGRNTRPYLIQAYNREMGNGVTVQMKEVDAPIFVAGRHWGGARMGYTLS